MAFKFKDRLSGFAPKLAPRFSFAPQISNLLLWRLSFGILVALCLVLSASIWFSGVRETKQAGLDGRRLLIKLEDGSMEGKLISLERKELVPVETTVPPASPPAAAASPEPLAAPSPTAETSAPAADAPAEAPASASEASSSLQNITPSATPLLDNSHPVKPAAVPLAAVNSALAEKTSAGTLPVIGPDGAKPWRFYAKPYERKGSLPMIAIIVTGLGQDKSVAEGAIRLPENMSLSFSPYARDIASWAVAARIAGHEIMIDLPLEPSNYPATDPGPYGLLVSKGTHENASRLQWLMSRVQGYTGFVMPQNEIFSSNDEALKALLQSLGNRGLMAVFGHDPVKGETKQMLETSPAADVVADLLLDEELSPTSIQARFISLERIASKRGYAIGIAQPFPLSMQQLQLWSATLQERGFVLVPVSFLAKMKFS